MNAFFSCKLLLLLIDSVMDIDRLGRPEVGDEDGTKRPVENHTEQRKLRRP